MDKRAVSTLIPPTSDGPHKVKQMSSVPVSCKPQLSAPFLGTPSICLIWLRSHDIFTQFRTTSLYFPQQLLSWRVIGVASSGPMVFWVTGSVVRAAPLSSRVASLWISGSRGRWCELTPQLPPELSCPPRVASLWMAGPRVGGASCPPSCPPA